MQLTRYAASVSYQGSAYLGWQKLTQHANTIQEAVETAISLLADEPIQIKCSGRTDSGVHATNQIIHFDSDRKRSLDSWKQGTNRYLPPDISINWVIEVDPTFHARYEALSRQYTYVIYNHNTRSPHLYQRMLWKKNDLSIDAMQKGANFLIGSHDFNAFRAARCQASHACRTIQALHIIRVQRIVLIKVEANGFLHHMVRNLVGSLLAVGEGSKDPEWIQIVLNSKNRKYAAATALPDGLYLTQVNYAPHFNIPIAPSVDSDLLFLGQP